MPTPVHTCQADGVTVIDPNTASACDYGSSYMCVNQQPWNVSETLSYAYVGVSIAVCINRRLINASFLFSRGYRNGTGVVLAIH